MGLKKTISLFLIFLIISLNLMPIKCYAYVRSALFLDLSRVTPRQDGWRNAWAAGLGAAFPFWRHLTFFLNFNRWGFEITSRDARLIPGRLILSPLTSGFHFIVRPSSIVSPLLSLGGGYFFSQYRFDERQLITIPEIIKLNKNIKGNFCWLAGAGVVARLSPRANLWLQIERYQTSLKIDTTIIDLNLGTIKKSESFKFSPYLYRLGLQIIL